MTTKFAVLGSPIAHSKSPALHKAAYDFLNLDFQYEMFEVDQLGFKDFLAAHSEFLGFSLTMPLKDEGFEIASVRDVASQKTSAANTLIRIDNSWQSFNTDIFGISQALAIATKSDLSRIRNVSLLGTGATSRSVMVALAELLPAAKVSVWGRTQSNVESLINFGTTLGIECQGVNDLAASLEEADLSVSSLPSGSIDEFWKELGELKSFNPHGYLFDVSYNPWPSLAVTTWGSSRVISGLEMLLFQAVKQVRLFASAANQEISATDEAIAEAMRKAIS